MKREEALRNVAAKHPHVWGMASRRVFYSVEAQCSQCHAVNQRGGTYGPSEISLMPEGLEHRLTVSDFRDLIAFLEQGER